MAVHGRGIVPNHANVYNSNRVPFVKPHPSLFHILSWSKNKNTTTKGKASNNNHNKAYVDDHVPHGVELVKLFGDGWVARSLLLPLQVSYGTV